MITKIENEDYKAVIELLDNDKDDDLGEWLRLNSNDIRSYVFTDCVSQKITCKVEIHTTIEIATEFVLRFG